MSNSRSQALYDIHNFGCIHLSREIFLHGYYNDDEEPGIDYRTATTFIKNLRILDSKETSNILVHQHTVGGEWTDGVAMFDAIKHSYSPVTFLMYAHARSMSSIIPQAADLRIMMPHTCFMVHNGAYATEGHYDAVLSEVEFYKKSESIMLDIYAEKCQHGEFFSSKKSMTKIKCMNYIRKKIKEKNDWYMDANEALYYGFCDGILGQDYETLEDIRR